MTTLLPLIALALAILALIVPPAPTDESTKDRPGLSTGLLVLLGIFLLLMAVAGYFLKTGYPGALAAALAFGGGLAVTAACEMAQRAGRTSPVIPIGLAVVAAGILHWTGADMTSYAQLGMVLGAAVGAWCLATTGDGFGFPSQCALTIAAVVACDLLGAKALPGDLGALTGVAFGLAVSISGLLLGLPDFMRRPRPSNLVMTLFALLLVVGSGYVVGGRWLEAKDAWMIFCGTAVVSVIVHWLLPADEPAEPLRFLIAAIIWIALGTAAFAMYRAFGMSIAVVSAASTLVVLRNPRALLSAGPLLALVYYRVFREAFPDASRALDIGQHYALIGIAVGAVVPLLPTEWLVTRPGTDTRFTITRILWALALAALPVPIAIILGPKGVVGFVAGLGFGALIEGLKGSRSLLPLTLAAGIGAFTTLLYGWCTKLTEMTRDEKQAILPWLVGAAVVVAALIAILSIRKEPRQA